jgi:hypothetical protein
MKRINYPNWRCFTLFMLISSGVLFAQGDTPENDLKYAQIEFVSATRTKTEESVDTWRFSVTVRHNDEGWDHYADRWQVIHKESGILLGERVLLHPHDSEQPFERSQSGIVIPMCLENVIVRASCTVHGFGGREIVLNLSKTDTGEDFVISR